MIWVALVGRADGFFARVLVGGAVELYPDEVARPGHTYNPFPLPDEVTTRFDYVYYDDAEQSR